VRIGRLPRRRTGGDALYNNTTGYLNPATGDSALTGNTTGRLNTANGAEALEANSTGLANTATGYLALLLITNGSQNIALGEFSGGGLTSGSDNINIGNPSVSTESNTIRIGNSVAFTDSAGVSHSRHTATYVAAINGASITGSPVSINSNGQLGVAPSSKRFKDEIKPMDQASEALFALKPVTFHFKKEIDAQGTAQFGLVAEDVEKVNPDLVVRDKEGNPYSVRYDQVNAMLLNEFLKEHRKVGELKSAQEKQEAMIAQQRKDFEATIAKLQATVAQQQKGIEVLVASLREQDSKIQKVSDQLELGKAVTNVVLNNR
jgi:uncharacterized coiled-coil protein SlyX